MAELSVSAGEIEILNGIFGAGVGLAISGAGFCAGRLRTRFNNRHVTAFWHPFVGRPLAIFVTEYPVERSVSDYAEIAKVAGGGDLISKGMALGLAELRQFAMTFLDPPGAVPIQGSRSGVVNTDNLVIIGSEVSNRVAATAMQLFRETYSLPFVMEWNDDRELVELKLDDGTTLQPHHFDGFGVDYALVVKASLPGVLARALLLISGCHMWGSHAASQAVVSHRILRQVMALSASAENVAFVIRTQIVNGASTGPELEFGGRTIILALEAASHQTSAA